MLHMIRSGLSSTFAAARCIAWALLIGVIVNYAVAWAVMWPLDRYVDRGINQGHPLLEPYLQLPLAIDLENCHVHAIGYPYKAMRCDRRHLDQWSEFRPPRAIYRSGQYTIFTGLKTQFPYEPYWPGWIFNTIVYALAWLVIGLILSRGRWAIEVLRARKRRCQVCGHSLRGIAEGNPCPECGRIPRPNPVLTNTKRLSVTFGRRSLQATIVFMMLAAAILSSGLAVTPTITPLHRAVMEGNTDQITELLAVGADPYEVTRWRWWVCNPVALAARFGDEAAVRTFLDAGVDPMRVEAEIGEWLSCLPLESRDDDYEPGPGARQRIADMLAAAAPGWAERDWIPATAARLRDEELARAMTMHLLEMRETPIEDPLPLLQATVSRQYDELLEALIARGHNTPEDADTMLAALANCRPRGQRTLRMIDLVLRTWEETGATTDPDARLVGVQRLHPLFRRALQRGDLRVARNLLERGFELTTRERELCDAVLRRAVAFGAEDLVVFTLELGADPTVADSRGRTAIDLLQFAPTTRRDRIRALLDAALANP
jgi:hypothetical protein